MRPTLHLFDIERETCEERFECSGCEDHSLEQCFCSVFAAEDALASQFDTSDAGADSEWDIPTREYYPTDEWWMTLLGGEG